MGLEEGHKEPQAILALSLGETTAYERDATVHDVFAHRVAETPDAVAVVADAVTLTYAELDRRANRLARHLQTMGIGPQAAVGVALARSPLVPETLLAILKTGATYVPLDPSYPRERLSFVVQDAGVTAILTEGAGHDWIPGVVTIVDLAEAAPAIAGQSASTVEASSRAQTRAYVMYTSGSTGRPKGVAIAHRSIVRLVRATNYVDVGASDTVLQYAPLAFDASTFEIWAPLLNGGRLAIAPPGPSSLADLKHTVKRFGVTTLWLTAAIFREAVEREIDALAGLRYMLTGGDVVSPAHAKRFIDAYPDCRLINGYGPTENTTFSCAYVLPSSSAIGETVPIGLPIANSSAFVLDSQLQPVPFGAAGELCVGGDGLALEYVNLPELTAERFVPNPFSPESRLYRTGDRARWRSDGVLEFLGRDDDQVKVRGFRIELGEIETALQKHEAVAGAAVVVSERDGEKELVAHVVLRNGISIDDRELRAWLTRTMPSYMIPHRIAVRGELPVTPNGKVDRVALASAPSSSSAAERRVPAFKSKFAQTEFAIAEIWCEILRSDDVPGPDENFFDAGGDSLRLLALHSRLREQLGADLTVTDLFEHCTLRRLTAFLGRLPVRA